MISPAPFSKAQQQNPSMDLKSLHLGSVRLCYPVSAARPINHRRWAFYNSLYSSLNRRGKSPNWEAVSLNVSYTGLFNHLLLSEDMWECLLNFLNEAKNKKTHDFSLLMVTGWFSLEPHCAHTHICTYAHVHKHTHMRAYIHTVLLLLGKFS